jgi:hypothetical protein
MGLSEGRSPGSWRAPCGCRLATGRPGSKSPPTAPAWSAMWAALVGELADRVGLTGALGDQPSGRRCHREAAVLWGLAVMLADGGDCLCDLAVLRDQPELFGPVASTATAWRVSSACQDPDGWPGATLVLATVMPGRLRPAPTRDRSGSIHCWPTWTGARRRVSRWPDPAARHARAGAAADLIELVALAWPSSPGPRVTCRSWSAPTAPGRAPSSPGSCAIRRAVLARHADRRPGARRSGPARGGCLERSTEARISSRATICGG